MSASALSDTLRAVRDEGLPELHNRNHLREARESVAMQETPFGPVVQHVEVVDAHDTLVRLPCAHPAALLYAAVIASASLATLFESRMNACPPSPEHPWNLVLYSDEVTPGNPLHTHNMRKFWGVYFTFLEFGPHATSREEAWFPLMTAYSNVINDVDSGISQVFGAIIKLFFNPEGFDFGIGGISLPLGDGRRFWCKLGLFLQDGAAHKMMWSSRAGACRLCLLCKNLFTSESAVVDADGTNLLTCNAVSDAECEPSTDDAIRTVARYLERKAGTMLPTPFSRLQQACGITHARRSILLDRSLDDIVKPTTQYMHDWMHTLFVDGVVNLVVYLLFEAFIADDRRTIYNTCKEFLEQWV